MNALQIYSPQELSRVIGKIYACALEPGQWPETCRSIAELCGSTGSGICIRELQNPQNDQLFVFGYQPEFLEQLRKHYPQSPMAASELVSSLGHASALLLDHPSMRETFFFRQVMEPFGIGDIIWFPALHTGGRTASMHAFRSTAAPPYGESELNLFKLLAPHVCRALAISDALEIKAVQSKMLELTLDALASGVFLTASDGLVVYMNAAAERQLKASKSISLVNGRLSPMHAPTGAALLKAISQAAADEISLDKTYSLAIADGMGAGYVVTVLPLARGQRRALAPLLATCAVFMQDPLQAPPTPREAFAELHRLTGGELRVLTALAQGLSGKEAAELLGISEATLRSHLQHIFSKTHTSRQTTLLHLLYNSSPPIAAPSPIQS